MKALLFILAASLLGPSPAFAQASPPGPQDAKTPASLDQELRSALAGFRGKVWVYAKNLDSGASYSLRGDERVRTASTIKLPILVTVFAHVAAGKARFEDELELTKDKKVGGAGILTELHDGLRLTLRDAVNLMIVLSDNTATNLLIGRLGTARVNERLEAYGLKETKLFRPTFRDGHADVLPELEREFGLGMTTPREMARLMALIAEGKAVNRSASDAMLGTLRRQQDRAMIPRFIAVDDRIQIGNKTGTDEEKHALTDGVKRHVRADAAIVTGPGFSYVIAIYARQVEDTRWGVDNDALTTGARISKMVFDYFSRTQ